MKQDSFHSMAYDRKKKTTRFDVFLSEMDKITPWAEMAALIEPHYPKAGRGRHPYPLLAMLRVYCVQQWYDLSDPAMEDWLYAVTPVQRFVGLDLGEDALPDETTILNFRRLLEKHGLQGQIFALVREHLAARGLLLKNATIVDATIIAAPSSTKNAKRERDPEMRQTKKGNQWYFGMKVHTGTDRRGVVHSLTVTDASVHDSQKMDELLHGEEKAVYGDKAYADAGRAQDARDRGVRWRVSKKPSRNRPLTEREREFNRRHSSVRAFVEHPYLVVKRLWGHAKVRYRGLEKNEAQMFMLFSLANLYRVRRDLLET
jgi:IS5 family transposase